MKTKRTKAEQRFDTLGRKIGDDRDGIFMRRGAYYISFIDAQGRRKQRKLKGVISLTEAKRLRNEELASAEKARVLGYTPPAKDSFADFMPRYLRHQKARLKPRSYDRTEGIVNGPLKKAFGPMTLAAIRPRDIVRYITDRSAEVGNWTVIKERNVLSNVFEYAITEEMIEMNPCDRVEPPKCPGGRKRYLQTTELRGVLEACPPWLRPIVALLTLTLMRRSELLGLRWMDVDRANRCVLLPDTKNGEPRFVYLNDLACGVIDTLTRGKPTERIFPETEQMTPENVSLAFLRACRKAGVADFRLHDLRHTGATWLRLMGSDSHTVAQLAGQKSMRVAMGYQHLPPTFLAEQVTGLDRAFKGELDLPALLGAAQA